MIGLGTFGHCFISDFSLFAFLLTKTVGLSFLLFFEGDVKLVLEVTAKNRRVLLLGDEVQ